MNRALHLVAALGIALGALGTNAFASSIPTASHTSSLAREWFRLALDLARTTPKTSPPVASRAFAYLGVTLYESLAPGMPGHHSLVGRLNDLRGLPVPDASLEHHWPSVANAALSGVAQGLFPSRQDRILELERLMPNRFRAELDQGHLRPDMEARSAAHGRALAAAILDWAARDGSDASAPYQASGLPGGWQPTAPGVSALLPYWGRNRPFAMPSGETCPASPHPAFSEAAGSAFRAQAQEVLETRRTLTPAQREVALFWSDDPGRTATPPGHWVSILTQVLETQNARLDVAAEAYARLGIALGDAFIGCWQAKYEYNLLRPVTYIQRLLDPTWQPLLNTPPFPEYPSGHSVASAAAATVLEGMFGKNFGFNDATHSALGMPTRSFASFAQAAEEAAISRLYGGIHFRAAIEFGLAQGRCIGAHASKLDLRQ